MHEILELLDSDWDILKHTYMKINNTYELSVIFFLRLLLGSQGIRSGIIISDRYIGLMGGNNVSFPRITYGTIFMIKF